MTQYQKDLVRMWDSMRDTSKRAISCIGIGVDECEKCLLADICDNEILYNAEKIIEIVTEWAKEHPFVTMRDKYKEVFGIEPVRASGGLVCPFDAGLADCNCTSKDSCGDCRDAFWHSEYKEPKKEGE